MIHLETLPRLNQLKHLSRQVKNFPITGLGIVQHAEHLGYADETVDFLKLFSKGIIFHSRSHFLEHCSLLEKLIIEERQSVSEYLRSPQG